MIKVYPLKIDIFFIKMNNDTNNNSIICSFGLKMPKDLIIYGSFFYILIFSIGLIGNSLVIYFIIRKKEMRNFTNYLLANLSLADLFVLLTNVPSGIHDLFAKERWYLGKIWCHLVFFVENTMVLASILTIFFITCDRYYVICRPLHVKSKMNPNRTIKLIVLIWILSLILNLPFFYFSHLKLTKFFDCTTGYKCQLIFNNIFFYFIIITYFIFFFIIGLVLLIMYLRIYHFLNKSNSFLSTCWMDHGFKSNFANFFSTSSEFSQETTSKNTTKLTVLKKQKMSFEYSKTESEIISLKKNKGLTFNEKNQHFESVRKNEKKLTKCMKQRKNLIAMLVLLILVFYLCLFPLKIWNLILMINGKDKLFFEQIGLRTYWYINISSRILFYLNSSVNPFLYNCFSKKFRNNFSKSFLIPKNLFTKS